MPCKPKHLTENPPITVSTLHNLYVDQKQLFLSILYEAANMKILLHSHFPAGHTYPMQAVAQSLIRRGHQVVWLASADNEVRVRAVGATFVATEAIAIVDEPLIEK